jgi:DNA mismatch repair protein MutS2
VTDPSKPVSRFTAGDAVQTPFGKGVVREVRNNGRLLVDVAGRALVIAEADVSLIDERKRKAAAAARRSSAPAVSSPARREASRAEVSVDLHGLTVEEALARAEHALNEALLADVAALRLIHGRSGGRIRAALHRWLSDIPNVRAFSLDPRNDGVTIVRL